MPTLLDLFSGCGGLALGSKNAGFSTSLAVDIDPILSSSFATNFPNARFLRADVASLTPKVLSELLPDGVDGVIGGPPCQGFSSMGKQSPDDPRRSLLLEFFRVVAEVKPAFFLMENVPGLAFPANKPMLDSAISSLGARWTIVGPIVLDASDFGAPTKRKRIFVFGFDQTKMAIPSLEDIIRSEAKAICVREAIGDLLSPQEVDSSLDCWTYDSDVLPSAYACKLRSKSGLFTGNQLTVHKEATVKRYATVLQGAVDPVGKHKRLSWDGLCPTLRAGTGSDRGSFQSVRPLHPDFHRVITPREAARLQGFPDDFLFHSTVWHSFRMIGNSVSPIIAEALLRNIKPFLSSHPKKIQAQVELETA